MSFSLKSPSSATGFRLTPFRGFVFITLLWVGIYLPGLGTLQLQHEEPRRALPGLHMLASGDWLVPRVGSDPYLRKPPLLNWAIALSCKLSGGVSEWAVRLPSVLATFALAITILGVGGRRWLGQEGGLIAATFFLVNFTMIESGRLAELEALYVSVTGIALVLWITSWRQEAGSWQLWLLPDPFSRSGYADERPNTSDLLLWGCSAGSSFRQKCAVPASPGAFAFAGPRCRSIALLGDSLLARRQQAQSDWDLAILVGTTRFTRVRRV